MSRHPPGYAAQVQAWADALRAGSTSTWEEFLAGGRPGDLGTAADPDRQLPGGGQLEVLRRLADTGVPDLAGLADLVLGTSVPGRGLIDVPLPWPGEPRRFGTPAVSPGRLPADELVRVCVGTLVPLLVGGPLPRPPARRRPWRLRRRRFRLAGMPGTAGLVRTVLLDRGLRRGSGSQAEHFVFAGPFEQMMAQRWVAGIQAGQGMKWVRMWRRAQANDRIPPGIAVTDLAGRLAAQFGSDRVHVVVAGHPQEAMDQVAGILGVASSGLADPPGILAADLLRVLNPLLSMQVGAQQRDRIVEYNWSEVVAGEPDLLLGAPRPQLDWAIRTSQRMAEELDRVRRGDGYRVHGEPGVIVSSGLQPGLRRAVPRQLVVDLGVTAIARAWTRSIERKG